MTARIYPWIIQRPRRWSPRRVRSDPCPRCGYDPITGRKKCPACLTRLERTDA